MSLRLQKRRTSQGHFPVRDRIQSRCCCLESRQLSLSCVSVTLPTTENTQETMKSQKVLHTDSSFNPASVPEEQELNNTLDFLPFI